MMDRKYAKLIARNGRKNTILAGNTANDANSSERPYKPDKTG
jgi:hypothetical protein